MKLNKRTIIMLSGGALLVAGVTACNHGMHFGTPEERGAWMVEKVTRELELNQAQQANLEQVKDQFLEARSSMKSDREQHRADVRAMLQQPVFDRDKANTMVSQKLDSVNTQAPLIIDAVGDFWDSLDDDQRAELREFIEDKMDRHHGHRRWY